MWKIDVGYPIEIGRLAKDNGAKHYLVVSSMNADVNAKLFYPRMKGELEERIQKIGFEKLSIFRPSLLLGKREEFRLGEQIGSLLFNAVKFMFVGRLRKYKAIEGKTVARAMYNVAQQKEHGKMIFSSEEIEERAYSDTHETARK